MTVGYHFDNITGIITFLGVPIGGAGSGVITGDYTNAMGAVAVLDVVYHTGAGTDVAVADANDVAKVRS